MLVGFHSADTVIIMIVHFVWIQLSFFLHLYVSVPSLIFDLIQSKVIKSIFHKSYILRRLRCRITRKILQFWNYNVNYSCFSNMSISLDDLIYYQYIFNMSTLNWKKFQTEVLYIFVNQHIIKYRFKTKQCYLTSFIGFLLLKP